MVFESIDRKGEKWEFYGLDKEASANSPDGAI